MDEKLKTSVEGINESIKKTHELWEKYNNSVKEADELFQEAENYIQSWYENRRD
ncbi:hypothetical protein MKX72_20130 [Priestia sp. FSL R5-0597]|uniref:hypothetical protein n=1 Tax=Priestia sp. FSL R5-0597 TaxID=2921580 RepID=UPI0030FCDA28